MNRSSAELTHLRDLSQERRVCDDCDADAVRCAWKEERFTWGVGDKAVELGAAAPVWTCGACGSAYTEGEAEDLRHEAVCRHLGVLSPCAIRTLRERLGLSQAEFARLTGFGVASIKRWESGVCVQSTAADRLLRLMESSDVVWRLETLSSLEPRPREPRFRSKLSETTKANAKVFRLGVSRVA